MKPISLAELKTMVDQGLITPYGPPNPRGIVPQKLQAMPPAVSTLYEGGIHTFESGPVRLLHHCDLETHLKPEEVQDLLTHAQAHSASLEAAR